MAEKERWQAEEIETYQSVQMPVGQSSLVGPLVTMVCRERAKSRDRYHHAPVLKRYYHLLPLCSKL